MSLVATFGINLKCTICGAGYGQCDCWVKCRKCGWLVRTGEKCGSPTCGGDGSTAHQVVAHTRRSRKRRVP